MGTKYKILEDFYDDWFVLIALHSNLEDYALAYALNTTLKTYFQRNRQDVELEKGISLPMFEWFDAKTDRNWSLFPNGIITDSKPNMGGLFKEMASSEKYYLAPELKEVDYFIKVDQEVSTAFVKSIQKVPRVITAYMIDCEKLNSKNNLIF